MQPELNSDQRLYVQTIFDYFHEQGKWPTYKTLDYKLTRLRRDLDIEEISKSLPGGFANAFSFNRDLNAPAILSVSAIYVCSGSKEDLADFVRAIRYGVERYFGAREDETTFVIKSDELKMQLGLSELALRKVGTLIKDASEYRIYDSFGGIGEDGGWIWTLSRELRHFDGVETIDQYLERLNTSTTASTKTGFRLTSSTENVGVPEKRVPVDNSEEQQHVVPTGQQYPYDVALSFAGEDRIHAEALAQALFRRRVKVFYDKYEKSTLWGKDLYTHLSDLYQKKARYCVMFFSQHYIAKVWTKHELKAAQARALNEKKEYILPIRLDNTEIPGILPTIAYLDWHQETAESVAIIICEKLGKIALLTKEQCRTEAIICMMKKDFEGALAFYKHASYLDPVDPQLYVDQSAMLDRLDRQEESLAACEQAIRLDPDCADAYYNKGDALIALGRFEEAIAACERAIHLNPNHLSSYVNKGVALSHLGRSEEALATYEGVLQMNPKYALAYYNKAAVLDRLGRTMEAQLARRKAKQYGYFNRKKEAVEVAR